MTDEFAPEDVINQIPPLTRERLLQFEQLSIITPIFTREGPRYRLLDLRRITLLCELTDDFEVNEDALVIIMSLLDQLYGARATLEEMIEAIDQEPSEIKVRLAQRLHKAG